MTDVSVLWAPLLASGPLTGILSARERARLAEAGGPDAAARLVLGRALLLAAAGRLTDPEAVIDAVCPVCGGPHGRPRLVVGGMASPVSLSLSHPPGLVIAAAAAVPVGLDAEPLDVSAERRDAARTVGAAPDLAHRPGFDALRHWTLVEAVLKADGRGLAVDPRTVRPDGATSTDRAAWSHLPAGPDGSGPGDVWRAPGGMPTRVAPLDGIPGVTGTIAVVADDAPRAIVREAAGRELRDAAAARAAAARGSMRRTGR